MPFERLSLVWKQLAALGLLLVLMITVLAWMQLRGITQQTEDFVNQSLDSHFRAFSALIELEVADLAVLASQIAATVDTGNPDADASSLSGLITHFDWLEIYSEAGALRYSWSALVGGAERESAQTPEAVLRLAAAEQVPKATIICNSQCHLLVATPAIGQARDAVIVSLALPLAMLLPSYSELTGGRLGLILDGAAPQLLAITQAEQLASVVQPQMQALVSNADSDAGYRFRLRDRYAFRTQRLALGDIGHPPIYATVLFDLERARGLLVQSIVQTVVVMAFGTVLTVLLMYVLVNYSLQRLTALTRMLPMLSEAKNFPLLRRMLERPVSRRQQRDELDDLGATLHQLTHELERLYGEEAASEAKSRFLATMSHEIRTPLNGVLGLLELLSETELNNEQRRSLHSIRESANALLGVINDVLDYSKLEAQAAIVDPVAFSPIALVEGVAETVAAAARSKGIRLNVACAADLPERCVGDAAKIRQILLNFASNAVKFTHSGEVLISALRCPARSGKEAIRFAVRDSGVGISEDAQALLFQRFRQADASTTRRYGGSGLGLAISKGLTELLGGQVGMQSKLGQGSTFYADIPLTSAEGPSGQVDDFSGYRVHLSLICQEEQASWASHLLHAGVDLVEAHQAPDLEIRDRGQNIELLFWSSHAVQPEQILVSHPVSLRYLFQLVRRHQQGRGLGDLEQARHVWPQFNATVLVVEDHAVNRQLLEAQLRKLGCTTQSAENGQAALVVLSRHRFDLLITDLHMPEVDGYELARHLHETPDPRWEGMPIAVLTASASEADEVQLSRLGITTKLRKPMLMATLAEALRTLLGEPVTAAAENVATEPQLTASGDSAHLDLQVIHETFDGDRELLRHFAGEFQRVNTPLIGELEALILREQWAELHELAHRLKGSARSLGATHLCDLLYRLEVCSAEEDPRSIMEKVRREFTLFCEALDAVVSSP